MSLTRYIKDLGRVVAYYPNLKKITGSTTASILLCQLLYWTDKTDDGWIRKTSDMIEEETGLTYNEQRTARDTLRGLDLIEDVYKRLDHEIWFRINQGALNALWEELGGQTVEFIEKKKKEPYKKKEEIKQVSKKAQVTKDDVDKAFEKPKGDWLDIALGDDAVKANKIYQEKKYIRETIEKKLNLTNIGENRRWISFIDFAYNRQKQYNEPIDTFLNWTLHNEAYDPAYWTPEKMKTLWGQAFLSKMPDENFVKEPPKIKKKDDAVVPPPRDMSLKNNL